MTHIIFFIFSMILWLIILCVDRKDIAKYLTFGALAALLAVPFELLSTWIGVWVHYSQPQVLGLSVYSILLYFPFVGFTYFLAKKWHVKE